MKRRNPHVSGLNFVSGLVGAILAFLARAILGLEHRAQPVVHGQSAVFELRLKVKKSKLAQAYISYT